VYRAWFIRAPFGSITSGPNSVPIKQPQTPTLVLPLLKVGFKFLGKCSSPGARVIHQDLLSYPISNVDSSDQQIKHHCVCLLSLPNLTRALLCLPDRYGFLRARRRAFPCFLRVFRTVVRDSFWPDLEGVARHAKFARVSLAAALKRRRSPLGVSFGGFPGRFALVNLFSPVLALTRRIMPATVDLVRSSRRAISDKVLPALYQVQTAERFSGVVSRLAVTGSEGILWINREGDARRRV
jgi:hypothetical protein